MAMVVRVLSKDDGFYSVRIKPEVGHAYLREFSKAALNEYVEGAKKYCDWKGYDFVFDDGTEEADRLYCRNEDGTEENDFIRVESNYEEEKDGCGKPDAVSFTVGQYVPGKEGHPFDYDNMITVSTEEARLFAQAILNLCNKIDE